MKNSNRYLVTGAAGFIGSVLAKKLIDEGNEVWTIDNLSSGRKENLPQGIHFIEGGCHDEKIIENLGDIQFDAILHLAAQASGEISFDDPVYDLRTNTESTLRLIKYGLDHDCGRFIYTSSMCVYGEVPDRPVSEEYPCKPLSCYGVSKLASEHYIRLYQDKGLKPTTLRLFNVYGANQNLDNLRQGMIRIFLAQLIRGDKVIVKGSGDRFRDFIHVNDVVDFISGIIGREDAIGGVFNVGTGIKTTVNELLDKMIRISGIKKEIIYSSGTPGDQSGVYADMSLVRQKFNFKCRYDLDEGLRGMIDWAKNG